MKGLISCYSTTGNTRLVADRIAYALTAEGVDTVVQNPVTKPVIDNIEEYDIVGFGTPTMAWKPALGFYSCLGLLPTLSKRIPAFVFCTSAGQPVNTLHTMAVMLAEKKFLVVDGLEVLAENNWAVARQMGGAALEPKGKPDESDLAAAEPFAKGLVERLNAQDLSPKIFDYINSPLHFLGHRTGPMQLRVSMGKKKVDRKKCNQCAICARACAVRAISLKPYPVFSKRCMGCFACFNLCPTDAITTTLAGGRGRYRGPALLTT